MSQFASPFDDKNFEGFSEFWDSLSRKAKKELLHVHKDDVVNEVLCYYCRVLLEDATESLENVTNANMAKDQSFENKNKSITLSQTREGAFVCSKDEPSLLNTNKPLAFGEYCFPFYELKDPLEQLDEVIREPRTDPSFNIISIQNQIALRRYEASEVPPHLAGLTREMLFEMSGVMDNEDEGDMEEVETGEGGERGLNQGAEVFLKREDDMVPDSLRSHISSHLEGLCLNHLAGCCKDFTCKLKHTDEVIQSEEANLATMHLGGVGGRVKPADREREAKRLISILEQELETMERKQVEGKSLEQFQVFSDNLKMQSMELWNEAKSDPLFSKQRQLQDIHDLTKDFSLHLLLRCYWEGRRFHCEPAVGKTKEVSCCEYCRDKLRLKFVDTLTYPRPVRQFGLLLRKETSLLELKKLLLTELYQLYSDDVNMVLTDITFSTSGKLLDSSTNTSTLIELGMKNNQKIIISRQLRKKKPKSGEASAVETSSGGDVARIDKNRQLVGDLLFNQQQGNADSFNKRSRCLISTSDIARVDHGLRILKNTVSMVVKRNIYLAWRKDATSRDNEKLFIKQIEADADRKQSKKKKKKEREKEKKNKILTLKKKKKEDSSKTIQKETNVESANDVDVIDFSDDDFEDIDDGEEVGACDFIVNSTTQKLTSNEQPKKVKNKKKKKKGKNITQLAPPVSSSSPVFPSPSVPSPAPPASSSSLVSPSLSPPPHAPVSTTSTTSTVSMERPMTYETPLFCHQCGYKLIANSKFCSQCGTRVATLPQTAEVAPVQQFDTYRKADVKLENRVADTQELDESLFTAFSSSFFSETQERGDEWNPPEEDQEAQEGQEGRTGGGGEMDSSWGMALNAASTQLPRPTLSNKLESNSREGSEPTPSNSLFEAGGDHRLPFFQMLHAPPVKPPPGFGWE